MKHGAFRAIDDASKVAVSEEPPANVSGLFALSSRCGASHRTIVHWAYNLDILYARAISSAEVILIAI